MFAGMKHISEKWVVGTLIAHSFLTSIRHWERMPRIIKNRSLTPKRPTTYKRAFQCRICKKYHPLRLCKRFLSMGPYQRKKAVEKFNYCTNCLAHEHSSSGCFSNTGCHICRKLHHTLLHQKLPSRSRKTDSAVSIVTHTLPSQTVTILPTAIVKIAHGGRLHPIRALIDTGSAISRISQTTVTKLGISTSRVENTFICQISIRAMSDPKARFSSSFRVDNRIAMKTPSNSLPSTFKEKFVNLILADPTFYENAPISADV
ncbi:uncharacterized protein LOC142221517 isoform X2 [Haematobia irritans]|uniref:uncharacterized protein LOC142221517 isoform X2 n=1 Tax=Haematobia irritans TaxID=7368 RepID=UPI003F4FA7FA